MIPHQPIFCNIQDQHNLGDMLCSAKGLFPEFSGSKVLDFRAVTDGPEPLIVGGGGMMHPGIDTWLEAQAYKRMVFAVGIGLNYHNEIDSKGWNHKLRACTLAGLRDKSVISKDERIHYCPCPTAGLLDWNAMRAGATRCRDTLIFQHYDRPIGYPFPWATDRITNRWSAGMNLASVALTLGRYRRVITNTYHGALWSARMGCKVVIWRPFSSRFSTGLPFRCPQVVEYRNIEAAFDIWDQPGYQDDVDEALSNDYGYLADFKELVLEALT